MQGCEDLIDPSNMRNEAFFAEKGGSFECSAPRECNARSGAVQKQMMQSSVLSPHVCPDINYEALTERYEKNYVMKSKNNIFLNGSTDLLILHFLSQRDCYIYELAQAIDEKSGHNLYMTQNAVYIAAYKLLNAGLISERPTYVTARMKRVYYHIEEAGRRRLEELMRVYQNTIEGFRTLLSSGIDSEDN